MGGGPISRKIAIRNTWMAPNKKFFEGIMLVENEPPCGESWLRAWLSTFNSFATESRSQRLGLPAVAYGKPVTAALNNWCYFVRQMWAPVKVDQSHGLAYYWPLCFSKNFSYWTIRFSWNNYLLRQSKQSRQNGGAQSMYIWTAFLGVTGFIVALLLLYRWNGDSGSQSSSSSSTGNVSESFDSDGSIATARVRPRPRAHSTRPMPATEFDIVIDRLDADDGKCHSINTWIFVDWLQYLFDIYSQMHVHMHISIML